MAKYRAPLLNNDVIHLIEQNKEPEQKLWIAVLAKAFDDAFYCTDDNAAIDALRWIKHGQDFNYVCGLAGRNPYYVRSKMLDKVIEREAAILGKKIQIKVSGKAEINHKNDKAKMAWDNSRSFSKKCYVVEKAPGTPSDEPTSGYLPEHENELPDDDLLQNGYNNFALVEIQIHSIEWLYLHRQGHRRALFTSTNGSLNKEWLTP